MFPKETITLAMETAIGAGSIAVFDGRKQIDYNAGGSPVSRTESLHTIIDGLLRKCSIDKSGLTRIVVSAGPGSFTGIRIGMATAFGLAAALAIPVRQLSMLGSMASAAPDSNKLAVAVSVGRNTVCLQEFAKLGDSVRVLTQPQVFDVLELSSAVRAGTWDDCILDATLSLSTSLVESEHLRYAGDNLAGLLGNAAFVSTINDSTAPLFIGRQK